MVDEDFLTYSKEVYRSFEVSESFDPRRGIFDAKITGIMNNEASSSEESIIKNNLEQYLFFTRHSSFKDTKDCFNPGIKTIKASIGERHNSSEESIEYIKKYNNFANNAIGDDNLLKRIEQRYDIFVSSYTEIPFNHKDAGAIRDGQSVKYAHHGASASAKYTGIKYKIDYKTHKNVDDTNLDKPTANIALLGSPHNMKPGWLFLVRCEYNDNNRVRIASLNSANVARDIILELYNNLTRAGITNINDTHIEYLGHTTTLLASLMSLKTTNFQNEHEIRLVIIIPKSIANRRNDSYFIMSSSNFQGNPSMKISYQGTVDNLTTPAHIEIITNNKKNP